VAAFCRLLLIITVVLTAACGAGGKDEVDANVASTITVTSDAFGEGDRIPQKFTCDGDEISPPLAWSGGKGSAWALVVDDPDAPGSTFVHWVVLDIAEKTRSVQAGQVPTHGVEVENSSGAASYAGPCPPSGEHHYRFTVYALDQPTGLTGDVGLDEALAEISDHATARGRLTGVYSRQ
jgi:Raf kinase inhibitor-like YbhB/YbcL family protein